MITRKSNGCFAKGNGGGPGRPKRSVELDYLKALNRAVSASQWDKIVKRAIADAIEGDAKARDWLSKYLLPAKVDFSPKEEVKLTPEQRQRGIDAIIRERRAMMTGKSHQDE